MPELRAHRISTCENCGSEKKGGLCVLCGEGERTTQYRLPFRTGYSPEYNNIENMLKFYLGENSQPAGEGSLW